LLLEISGCAIAVGEPTGAALLERAALLMGISGCAFAVGEPTGAALLELSLLGGMCTERVRVRRTRGSL